MDQNALGQSDCRIFQSTISPEQNDWKAWFFACFNTNSWKLKVDWKVLGLAGSKMGVVTLGSGH